MALEENLADFFRARASGVVAVFLFGSQASGNSLLTSDVDRGLIIAKAASVRRDLGDLTAFLSAVFEKAGITA